MTKDQLLKFIELVNAGSGDGMMRLVIAGEQAGFDVDELPKPTYGGGTYPIKTPHGIIYRIKDKWFLRDYTPEELEARRKEQAEMMAGASRLASGSINANDVTWRELELYFEHMTPEQHAQYSKRMAVISDAQRSKG